MKPTDAQIETLAKWLFYKGGSTITWDTPHEFLMREQHYKMATALLTKPPTVLVQAIRPKEKR